MSRGDPERGATLQEWRGHSGNVSIHISLLCAPSAHIPLLSISHLFSYIILGLVVISEFLYLYKTLNLINIKMPYYQHADCLFYGHRNQAIITRTVN